MLDRQGQGELGPDAVAVASPVALAVHVPGSNEVGHDALRRAFGDVQPGSYVAHPRARVVRDQQQRLAVVGIGIGKPSTPTPAGRFWIRERITVADPRGPYGPQAFGTSAYSSLAGWPGGGVVGIHGTNQPYLIPGQPSHGCIRVPNRSIRQLARLMPLGTPVWIR